MMEQKNDGSFADSWLERRRQTGSETINDTDYLTMLQELSRGQQ